MTISYQYNSSIDAFSESSTKEAEYGGGSGPLHPSTAPTIPGLELPPARNRQNGFQSMHERKDLSLIQYDLIRVKGSTGQQRPQESPGLPENFLRKVRTKNYRIPNSTHQETSQLSSKLALRLKKANL